MKNIKCLIADFDDVYYDSRVIPDNGFKNLEDKACIEAGVELFPDMGLEESAAIVEASNKEFNYNALKFVMMAEEQGQDRMGFIKKYRHTFYDKFLDQVMSECSDMFVPTKSLFGKFTKVAENIEQIILSHGHKEKWIEPLLEHMGYTNIVKPENILGMESYGCRAKYRSDIVIRTAIELSGREVSELAFVEDTIKNLVVAKKSFPELTTILLADKMPEDSEQASSVDLLYSSMEEMLDAVISEVIEPELARKSNIATQLKF